MSGRRRKDAPKDKDKASPARKRRPVPEPPKSLVSLIQKNKSVLTYFNALNENLVTDVDRWKVKSRHYQTLYEEQLAENEALKKAAAKQASKKRKRREPSVDDRDSEEEEHDIVARKSTPREPKPTPTPARSDEDEEEEDGPPRTISVQKDHNLQNSGDRIDDSMFELGSSSDDEGVGDYRKREAKGKASTNKKSNPTSRDQVKSKTKGKSITEGNKKNSPSSRDQVKGANLSRAKGKSNTEARKKSAPNSLHQVKKSDQSKVKKPDSSKPSGDKVDKKANQTKVKKSTKAGPREQIKSSSRDQVVDDSMFDFDDDSDDSDEHDQEPVVAKKSAMTTTEKANDVIQKETSRPSFEAAFDNEDASGFESDGDDSSGPPFWKQQQQFILSELLDAYHCLQHLGVELVERNDVEEERGAEDVAQNTGEAAPKDAVESGSKADQEEDEEGGLSFLPDKADTAALKRQLAENSDDDESKTKVRFQRRSNEDVICDMLHTVKTLTRVQIRSGGIPREYHPFRIPPKWIPCGDRLLCEGHDHPAYVAKTFLFRALSVMYTYCGAGCLGLSSDSWESLFEGGEQLIDPECKQGMMIGLRDRKEMVEQLMQSMYGEISGAWAVGDRAVWMDMDSLMYDPDAEAEIEGGEDGSRAKIAPMSYQERMMANTGPKGQALLSTIAERRVLVQLIVNLSLFQKDPQQAFQLACNYMLSAVPSLASDDDYPKFQPPLSLVVLEAMLDADKELVDDCGDNENNATDGEHDSALVRSYFGHILDQFQKDGQASGKTKAAPTLARYIRRALSLSVHTTAIIWRRRLESNDQRIADSARIEWACYLRLLESQRSWLMGGNAAIGGEVDPDFDAWWDQLKEDSVQLVKDTQQALNEQNIEQVGADDASTGSFALALAFVVNGDFRQPWAAAQGAFHKIQDDSIASTSILASLHAVSSACCMAFRENEIRLQEKYRQSIGALGMIPDAGPGGAFGKVSTLCLLNLLKCLKSAIGRNQQALQKLGETLLHCCSLVSNGEIAYEVIDLLLSVDTDAGGQSHTRWEAIEQWGSKSMIDSLVNVAQVPTVRVINLQRRSDRMNLMISQAIQSGIFLLKGVATLGKARGADGQGEGDQNKTGDSEGGFLFGGYAIDGKTPLEGISATIYEDEPSTIQRQRQVESKLVARQWRPHDLKAFDRMAINDEKVLVRVSDSERACALSHIASWRGVVRSLASDDKDPSSSSRMRFGRNIRRLVLSSGFARGAALDPRNCNMPPAPVCVVLEDDAILVDRFADRLNEILEELPRDFHFCSLGYSRPRTAPIVKFSKHLGIPTCIFYLTGYILSLDGAQHLLDSLPVRGPVDSWIGFKMVANWDNDFGTMVGVGTQSKPNAEPPSKKDISTILRFRAYAAMTPLCNQKVGGGGGASSAGVSVQNWRLRDTDIEYSGAANYTRR